MLSCSWDWLALFPMLNQPLQEVGLLLKCKFYKLTVNATFCCPVNSSFTLQLGVGELRMSSAELFSVCVCVYAHTHYQAKCACMVVLICAPVHVGSVSWPGSGFGEVSVISTRLLQLWRHFFLIRQIRAGQSWWWVLMVELAPRRPASLSGRLVVFHQFFQSSIDSGLCMSEARALWRWLRLCADRKTLSHDSAVHRNTKREAFVTSCCF